MKNAGLCATLVALGCVLSACTTTGVGGGHISGQGGLENPVSFSWTSTDGGMTGSMTAALPEGVVFQGRFFQITRETRADMLMPLWHHWHNGWNDWPYWGGPYATPVPATQFITYYSGKVVATLESPDQQHMRCRFHLEGPSRGMSGGGEGECQLSQGRVVRAVFPGK